MTKNQARILDRQTNAIAGVLLRANVTHPSQTTMKDYRRAERKAHADGERVRRQLGIESLTDRCYDGA